MPVQRREGHMRGWIVSGAACCALAVRQTAGPVTFDLHADAVTRPGSVTVGPAASVCWFGLWAAMRVCVVTSRVTRGVGAAAVSRVCTLSAVWHRVLGSGAMSGAVCGGPGTVLTSAPGRSKGPDVHTSTHGPRGRRVHLVHAASKLIRSMTQSYDDRSCGRDVAHVAAHGTLILYARSGPV
jgi:hypothetical protein